MPRDPVLKPSTLKGMRGWVRRARKYPDVDEQTRQALAVIEATLSWVLREGPDPLVPVLQASEARLREQKEAADGR